MYSYYIQESHAVMFCILGCKYPNKILVNITILPHSCLNLAAECGLLCRALAHSALSLALPLSLLLVCRSIKQTGRRRENVLRLDVLCQFTPQKYTPRAKNGVGLGQQEGVCGAGDDL